MDIPAALKYLYISILSITIVLASGCLTVPAAPAQPPIPDWLQTPPSDSKKHIYGIGEGFNLDEAKQSALRDIAGKLATNVSSNSESKASDHDGKSSRYFRQKVNTFIKDTKLSSYETIKAVQQQGQFYVLVAMSREKFVKENQARLDDISEQIQAYLSGVSSKNNLLQLVNYNKVLKLSLQAKDLLALMRVTDSSFDEKPYLSAYLSYQQKEKALTEKTQFSLKPTQAMKPLSLQIKKTLQMSGFQVDTSKEADSVIEVVGVVTRNEIFSTKNVSIKFEILVKTNTNQLIKSSRYHLNGSSTSSFAMARDGALNQFTAKIRSKTDIYKLLGMSE